jgi:hypothetical protein
MSLSTVINGRSPSHALHIKSLVSACPDNRILAESDFGDVNFCAERTWDMVWILADIKGWQVEKDWDDSWAEHSDDQEGLRNAWGVVRHLEANWKMFLAPSSELLNSSRLQNGLDSKVVDGNAGDHS